jgi:hypothetical protein
VIRLDCRTHGAVVRLVGIDGVGRVEQPPFCRQDQLTEDTEVAVAGHGERLGEGHQHPLETLQVRVALASELDLRRRDSLGIAADAEVLDIAEDGLAKLLGHGAADLNRLAGRYLRAARLDEDAVGSGGISIACSILDVEAAKLAQDLGSILGAHVLDATSGFVDDDADGTDVDFSGIQYDGTRSLFWIVSDKAKRLFLYDWNRDRVIQSAALGHEKDGEFREIEKAEGVAVDPRSHRLYVVSDAEARLYVFDVR